jgi:hypothetical protein
MASLTDAGLALAKELDEPTLQIASEIFGEMSEYEMRNLIDLLVAARKTASKG